MATRKTIDSAKIASLASRPGIDTRRWLAKAVVTDVGYDAQHGLFADIRYLDDGQADTAIIATPYAGNSFGASFPIRVNDTVLVAIPNGDPGTGPMIIAREWNSGDPPPNELDGDNKEPTNDVVIRVEEGQKLRIITDGAGEVLIQSRGTGGVRVEGSKVVVQTDQLLIGSDTAEQPVPLGTYLQTWLEGHTHPTGVGPSGPPTVGVPFDIAQILSANHKLDK